MNKVVEILKRERATRIEMMGIYASELHPSAPVFTRLEDEIDDIDRFLADYEEDRA